MLLLFTPSFAAPAPPVFGVNHATRECAKFFSGDECVSCGPPAGWVVIEAGASGFCPGGYRAVDARPVCVAAKNQFCCTRGHSGAPGNCLDLVLNEREKKCAFVDNLAKCRQLPKGWQPPGGEPVCPFFDYRWTEELLICPGEFSPPLMNGMRVDRCLTWGTDCDQPAADYFCRKQEYAKAESFRWEFVQPTLIMGDGRTCAGQGRCGGFSFIRCEKSEP